MLRRMQTWASSDVFVSFLEPSVLSKGWNLQYKQNNLTRYQAIISPKSVDNV